MRTLLTALVSAALVASPAHAGDAPYRVLLPGADQSGLSAFVAPGFAACGANVGVVCAASGAAQGRALPKSPIAAWAQVKLIAEVPAGTTVVGGTVTVAYRTHTPGLHARLVSRVAGAWRYDQLPDQDVFAARTIAAPVGATSIALSLYAPGAIVSTAVLRADENVIELRSLDLVVRDSAQPALRWVDGAQFLDGAWHRGEACAVLHADDVGLGVHAIVAVAAGREARVAAPAGPRLQPRPVAFDARPCFDTAAFGDGVVSGYVVATDGDGPGGLASAALPFTLRVDATPPTAALEIAERVETRRPELRVGMQDLVSGVVGVALTIDGDPVEVAGGVGRLAADLAYGAHTATLTVTDAAGNQTTAVRRFVVADSTPPSITDLVPADGAVANPLTVIGFTIRDLGSGLTASDVGVAIDGGDVRVAGSLGDDGRFAFDPPKALQAGAHRVRVLARDRAGNEARATWSFTVAANAPVEPPAAGVIALRFPDATVRVRAGFRARVSVLLTDGAAPLAGRRVDFSWSDGRPVGTADTAADGTAAIVVDPGRGGELVARSAGAANASVRLVVDLSLRLLGPRAAEPGAVALRGRVLPGRVARIAIEFAVGGSWHRARVVRSDRSGRFRARLTLPAPGIYVVRARIGRTVSRPATIRVR